MRINISLDVSPAYTILKYLETRDSCILKALLDNRGIRYMLFHNNLTSNDFVKILKSIAEGRGELLKGTMEFLYDEYSRYSENILKFMDFLLKIVAEWNSIKEKVFEMFTEYLPEWSEVNAKVYLVLGGDDAYGVNLLDTNAVLLNIGKLRSQEVLVEALAHELHHKALWKFREVYQRLLRRGFTNLRGVYSITSEILSEGIASIISRSFGPFQKYLRIRQEIDKYYRRVKEAIIAVYNGVKTEEEALNELYPNMGPIYMVGIDMSLKIEEKLSREGIRELLNDTSTCAFFKTYNKIAGNYKYSEQIVSILEELKQKIEEIY